MRTKQSGVSAESSSLRRWTDAETGQLWHAIVNENVLVYSVDHSDKLQHKLTDLNGKVEGRSAASCWERIKVCLNNYSGKGRAKVTPHMREIVEAVEKQKQVRFTRDAYNVLHNSKP